MKSRFSLVVRYIFVSKSEMGIQLYVPRSNGMSSKVDSVGQSPGKNHININQWDDVDQQIGDILRGLNASNCGFHVVRKIISPKPSHLDWKVWGMVGIAHVPR